VTSANVVGDVPGRELPGEVVVIGAHLDSWDLGAGAIDDGAGCAIALETARLLVALGLEARRTVRVVLFMNEENGLSGAKAYAAAHQGELARHVAALEADSGGGRPIAVTVTGGPEAVGLVKELVTPLKTWVNTDVHASEWGGADLIPLQSAGVPVLEVKQDMSTYFDWHHTAADTVDKIDPVDLALAVAAFSTVTQAIADSPTRLPPPLAATAPRRGVMPPTLGFGVQSPPHVEEPARAAAHDDGDGRRQR
jgi:Zn-dependent M28 family amino/carboxypeptidase